MAMLNSIGSAKAGEVRWQAYSIILIVAYASLQAMRWVVSPQFVDIYYHLLTAWGFIKAGGYTGWDFWQYAPAGRIHMYPPLFHVILAGLLSLGIHKIFLVKLLEAVLPLLLLSVVYRIIKNEYGQRMGFFTLLLFGSSFSFFLSLANYLPSTLAFVFGFLSLEYLFEQKTARAALLLAACFYTHIGISYLFTLSFLLYAALNKEERKNALRIIAPALLLAIPVLFKQASALKSISLFGISNENYLCEFKVIEYALAGAGLFLLRRATGKQKWLLCFFLASFIFIIYPYRFFAAQGYLATVVLAAFALDSIYQNTIESKGQIVRRLFVAAAVVYFLCLSFTLSPDQSRKLKSGGYKLYYADSVVVNILFPERNQRISKFKLWFPEEYLSAAELIKRNSGEDDIVYGELYTVGMGLAALSGRASANGLLPEIKPLQNNNPFVVSKIIIFLQDAHPVWMQETVKKFSLEKIGENRLFVLYKNPGSKAKIALKKASVPFNVAFLIALFFINMFFISNRKNHEF